MPRNPYEVSMRAFLTSYAETASVTKACEAAKIHRSLHYRWLESFPKYQKRFIEAERHAGDTLESEAVRRATEGVVEAVYYQGRPVGAVKRYSDGLMMTLLRGFKPAKYSTSKTEVSGPDGGPMEIVLRLNAARARMNEENAAAAAAAAKGKKK
jgi:hypothetical protein